MTAPALKRLAWDELVASALLGTERRPWHLNEESRDDPLSRTLNLINRERVEHALLDAAAVVSLYRDVGHRSKAPDVSLPAAAPSEPHTRCHPGAAARLALMLGGRFPQLIPEWLAVAAAGHQRPPEELLPDLLERATHDWRLREPLLAASPQRAPWLATLNPAWSWVNNPVAATRRELAATRRSDPADGLARLETSWGNCPGDARETLIHVLEINLSSADEEFLERALDDRRKEVRQTAALLLSALPGSRLAARMAARTVPLLGFGRRALRVELPGPPDTAAQRDGLDAHPPGQRPSASFWLEQQVAATPLGSWPLDPDEAVRQARATDYANALTRGWASAAMRQRDRAWAAALLETDPTLVTVVPNDAAWATIIDRINRSGLADPATITMLEVVEVSDRLEMARAVVDALAIAIHQPLAAPAARLLRAKLPVLATRLDPEGTLDVAEPLHDPPLAWRPTILSFLDLLTWRSDLAHELRGLA